MKKVLISILCLVVYLSFTTGILALDKLENSHSPVYSPASVLYLGNFTVSSFDVIDDGTDTYMQYIMFPGTYNNGEALICFSEAELNPYEYPYLKFEYRTDSPSLKIDITVRTQNGESWPSVHPQLQNNGDEWVSCIFNIGTVTGGAFPDTEQWGSSLVFKPWNSGEKTLTEESYFDLKYLAFFKTEEEAEAYVYDPDDDTRGYTFEAGLIKDGNDILDTLNAEFDERVEQIKNSPTSVTVTGTKYYVSERGNDKNDGLSPQTPWQTLEKVSEFEFSEGDGVFFKRGDRFRANGHTLELQSGVTYSAYGTGEKPVFVGSVNAADPSYWEETDAENVYKFINHIPDCGCIVFDGGRAWGIKMTGNAGVSVDNGVVHNGIDEPFQSGGKEFVGYESLENNLEFVDIEGSIFLYSRDGNPGEVFESIELSPDLTGASASSVENTVFDNIKLVGYGHHGVTSGSVVNFTVQNCIFGWIGGSDHRLGNAIENWGNADGFTVDSCWFYQIYDCCYTTQTTRASEEVHVNGVEFKNNVSEYSNSGPEIWNNSQTDNSQIYYSDVKVHDNYVRNNGYGWSHQRPLKDGNFYYGAFEKPGHNWDSFKVYDNKFFICSSVGLKSRYISEANAHFNGNLYVIGEDKLFARAAADLLDPVEVDREYPYTDASLSMLRSNTVEKDGEFYSVSADYVPEPFDYASANDIYHTFEFFDISDHWAKKEILTALNREYFSGISKYEFAPNASMTRAMLFTVLARYTSTELEQGSVWYDGAVSCAVENGYTSSENARPDDAVTRGELALVIYRYLSEKYLIPQGEALDFIDCDKFSDAINEGADFDLNELSDAIDFCTRAGIINGYEDQSFRASEKCTRAQIAAVIVRMGDAVENCALDTERAVQDGHMTVIDAQELNDVLTDLQNGSTKEYLEEDGSGFVRFSPAVTSGTVQAVLYQNDLDGVDFYKMKYVKFKYRINCDAAQTGSSLDVGLFWRAGEQWLHQSARPFISKTDTWLTGDVCYDEFTASTKCMLPNKSLDTYFYSFKPFGNNKTMTSEHYFDLESVAFFDDPLIAASFEF